MKKNITQLHNVDPEEYKREILSGVQKQLERFSKNFTPKEPNQWITRKEVSELLGVSLVTIHDWSKKGILHPYKMGNRVRFKLSEIERSLLQSNEKTQE
ncbi:MAG TPA: helix-turn-helix domain-containing protein [Salinimicrobium sp.]|nr:helix-turn-helix domain-containing protein [Salinimicrobium sp.]